jgi:hypothetical protein
MGIGVQLAVVEEQPLLRGQIVKDDPRTTPQMQLQKRDF